MHKALHACWNKQDSLIAGTNAPAHLHWLVSIVEKCEHVAWFGQAIHEQVIDDDLHVWV